MTEKGRFYEVDPRVLILRLGKHFKELVEVKR